ncbi:TfoX/Sxy family protein [Pontimicrobium sp. MEBiC06410]|jgi:TfoX/Sxy family transcriptional regulator of competence genes
MAYNAQLVNRIKEQLQFFPETFTDKKMFGGIAFLYKGKMTIGVIKNKLMVRVISEKMETELEKPNVIPMDFTKKPMKEFIYVLEDGIATELELLHYIELGLEHAKSKL